jgi:Coenzyme PQQ synthesis protein D (PqqD)
MDNVVVKPNYSAISYEDFGEEVVIVKLDSGVYYSLSSTAVSIWRLLETNIALDKIKHSLLVRYDADPTTIQQALTSFLADLQTEELVTVESGEASYSDLDSELPEAGQQQSAFIKPELNRYTDMQELLLLDPIHEVDETGWPIAIASTPEQNAPAQAPPA